MAFILGILLTGGMWYIVYQHYARPFKNLKKAKDLYETANKIKKLDEDSEQITNKIINDKIYQERIAPLKQDLINKEITYEIYKEICNELAKERYYELYKDNCIENTENEMDEEQLEKNNKFAKILYILMISMLVSTIAFYIAKYITRSQLN